LSVLDNDHRAQQLANRLKKVVALLATQNLTLNINHYVKSPELGERTQSYPSEDNL